MYNNFLLPDFPSSENSLDFLFAGFQLAFRFSEKFLVAGTYGLGSDLTAKPEFCLFNSVSAYVTDQALQRRIRA